MPRRNATTSSTPSIAPPADSSSSLTRTNSQSTRQSHSQPPVRASPTHAVNEGNPAVTHQDDVPAESKRIMLRSAAATPQKRIIRPPKYHETENYLEKERSVQSELGVPSHLGHRAGECYRLAATMSRFVKHAAMGTRPISWGYGTKDGTLGHGNSEFIVEVLKRVATFRWDQLRQVSAGDKLSVFLTNTGRVFVCGRLFLHQDGAKMWSPTQVSFDQTTNRDNKCQSVETVQLSQHVTKEEIVIVNIEAGHLVAYAIDSQGRVYAWGTKRYGQLGLGEEETSTPSGKEENDIAIEYTKEDELDNQDESQNDGTDEEAATDKPILRHDAVQTMPRRIQSDVLEGVRIIKVSAGNHFVLAMSSCGRAFSWGWNWHGQLGLGERADRGGVSSPHQIRSSLDSVVIVDIAAGHSHSLVVAMPRTHQPEDQVVLTSYSMVFAFGRGRHGCLGTGGEHDEHEPVEVTYFRGLQPTSVAAGHDHSLVLCSVGSVNYVYAFGGNAFGQLGIAQSAMTFSDMPMLVDELSGLTITSMGAGAYVSSALDGNGEVYTWGDGTHGKTARPDKRTTFVPWKIPSEAGSSPGKSMSTSHRVVLENDGFITQLSMGAHHSLALYRTEGKPDRWRKFPLGEVARCLDIRQDGETQPPSIFCESSGAHVGTGVLGIALHCEQCGLGPLCRVCTRRCHRNHKLIPRHVEDKVKIFSLEAIVIPCACGRRRPPPPTLRSSPNQILPSRSNKPPLLFAQSTDEVTTEKSAAPAYCALASVPKTVPEDSVLR